MDYILWECVLLSFDFMEEMTFIQKGTTFLPALFKMATFPG